MTGQLPPEEMLRQIDDEWSLVTPSIPIEMALDLLRSQNVRFWPQGVI